MPSKSSAKKKSWEESLGRLLDKTLGKRWIKPLERNLETISGIFLGYVEEAFCVYVGDLGIQITDFLSIQ